MRPAAFWLRGAGGRSCPSGQNKVKNIDFRVAIWKTLCYNKQANYAHGEIPGLRYPIAVRKSAERFIFRRKIR